MLRAPRQVSGVHGRADARECLRVRAAGRVAVRWLGTVEATWRLSHGSPRDVQATVEAQGRPSRQSVFGATAVELAPPEPTSDLPPAAWARVRAITEGCPPQRWLKGFL